MQIVKIGYDKGFWEKKHESIKIDKPDCDADCVDKYAADNEIYVDQSGATAIVDPNN